MRTKWADLVFWVKWEVRTQRERLWMFGSLAVARRLPRWLRYWVTIDSFARATTGKYGDTVVPELLAMDVLERI